MEGQEQLAGNSHDQAICDFLLGVIFLIMQGQH